MTELDKCPRCKSPVAPSDFYCRICGADVQQAHLDLIHTVLQIMKEKAVEDAQQQRAFMRERNKRIWLGRLLWFAILAPLSIVVSAGLFWLSLPVFFIAAFLIGLFFAYKFVLPFAGIPGRHIGNNILVVLSIILVYVIMY